MTASFPPSPFDPIAASASLPKRSLKPWLFGGCGLLVVFFLAAAVTLAIKKNEILAWSMTSLEERLEPRLESVPPEGRQRLATAFTTARSALTAGRYDLFALERAQTKILAASSRSPGTPLTEEQLAELAEVLEAIERGVVAPAPEAAPEPAGE